MYLNIVQNTRYDLHILLTQHFLQLTFDMLDYSIALSHMLCVKAFFDMGAAVNLIKMDVFRKLSSSSQGLITTLPPDVNLNGISGKIILPHGKVLLSLSLSLQGPDIRRGFKKFVESP